MPRLASSSRVVPVSPSSSVRSITLIYMQPMLMSFAEQGQYQPLATEMQVPIIYAGVNGLLDSIPVDQITKWEAEFREHLTATQSALLSEIATGAVTPELEAKIKKAVEDHVSSFTS